MPTIGTLLTTIERDEQLEKHGFSVEKDAKYYQNNELVFASLAAILAKEPLLGKTYTPDALWPPDWDDDYLVKILKKDRVGQLKVAAALLCAEIDRICQLDTEGKAHNQLPDLSRLLELEAINGLDPDKIILTQANSVWIGDYEIELDQKNKVFFTGPLGEDSDLYFYMHLYNKRCLSAEVAAFDTIVERINIIIGNE